ncbi:hypothetical protein G6F68_017743 [Rhizopus microsporus]|nr:hypothetical protein G6F68_017743 [Rhizopus microsporus]
MAATANAAVMPSGQPAKCENSDRAASTPEPPISHQFTGLAAGAGVRGAPSASGSGVMSSDLMAAMMRSSAPSACTTVSTRCIRLKSSACTPSRPSSFLRISVSSVGQSICPMRRRASNWPGPAASVAPPSLDSERFSMLWAWPQQAASGCAWRWP